MNAQRSLPALAGLTLAVLLVVPSGQGSGEITGPAQIRITNRQLSVTAVDIGRGGRSPGDLEILRQSLFNQRVTKRSIGYADLVCTFVDRRNRSCRGTYFLPRGKLVVGGTLSFRQFYQLAILGGTGIYENARGTVTVTRTATRPVRDSIIFRLVG